MVPATLIILLFLGAFLLTLFQYVMIDAKRRILNLRFLWMVGAAGVALCYPLYIFKVPGDRHTSWLFLILGVFWMLTAYVLLRRMPPRETY
jgi:hypothetical protein